MIVRMFVEMMGVIFIAIIVVGICTMLYEKIRDKWR